MSIWQTSLWQQMLKKSSQTQEFFEVDGIYIEKRQVSFGQYGLFILWADMSKIEKNHDKLSQLCQAHNCLFIQYENCDYNTLKTNSVKIEKWKDGYYKKFITPFTAVIDLELSQEEILAQMKPKGRYNIRLAEKKWIEVKILDKTNENISAFHTLIQQTASRDGFWGNTLWYYKAFLESLPESELFWAFKDDVLVAAGIFIFTKDVSIYYYGASSSEKQYRNLMAPYVLQFKAIEYAQDKKSKLFDFLWVAGPGDIKSDLAWVTDFKMKLTPDRREVSRSYIYINKKVLYWCITLLRRLKK